MRNKDDYDDDLDEGDDDEVDDDGDDDDVDDDDIDEDDEGDEGCPCSRHIRRRVTWQDMTSLNQKSTDSFHILPRARYHTLS